MSNHLFDQIKARMPGSECRFITLEDGRSITYGAVMAGSAQLAHVLTVIGVKPGDRVAVQVEKSAEAILLYLACLRAGAIFLPLNTAYTTAELAYFLGDAKPSLVICDPARREAIAGIAGDACLETLDASGAGSLMQSAAGQSAVFTYSFFSVKQKLLILCLLFELKLHLLHLNLLSFL